MLAVHVWKYAATQPILGTTSRTHWLAALTFAFAITPLLLVTWTGHGCSFNDPASAHVCHQRRVDTSWMIQPSLRRSAAKPKAALTGEQWHRVAFTIATANVLALH